MKKLQILCLAVFIALFSLTATIYLDSQSKQEKSKMATYAQQIANPAKPLSAPGFLQPLSTLNPDGSETGLYPGYGSSATPAGAGSGVDQATLDAYGQSIGNTQSAIDRLGGQQASGNNSIDASYTNALNQLLLGKNQANATYDTTKHQTGVDYVGAKNTIGANAGNSLNGLLRLLGSRGAGGSSAATISAPGAVARNATLQRTDVGNTFGANNQALDTNWNNYLTGYNNEVSSAGNQRDQSKQSLQQQIDNNRATLLQSLASLTGQQAAAQGGNATAVSQPYLDQANALLDKTSNYTTAPINYQTQAYTAPDLAKYTTNPNATPTFNGQTQANDYTSPYLAALLGKKQLVRA